MGGKGVALARKSVMQPPVSSLNYAQHRRRGIGRINACYNEMIPMDGRCVGGLRGLGLAGSFMSQGYARHLSSRVSK